MHLNQIEAFVQVVKQGSFSKAAGELYLSQSTVSVHINKLEEELGCRLIIRTPKSVFPSEFGEVFFRYAVQVLRIIECAEGAVTQYKEKTSGALTISASTVPSINILPKSLSEFSKAYPDINITVIDNDSGEVVNLVESMEIEIGIAGYAGSNPNCNFDAFCRDQLTIITPNTEQYRSFDGVVSAEVLENSNYITRESGSGTQKQATAFLNSIGVSPNKIKSTLHLQSTESVCQAVLHGCGIAIVSKIAVAERIERGELLSFDYDSPLLSRHFYIVTHKYVPLTPLAELFANFLKKSYASETTDL